MAKKYDAIEDEIKDFIEQQRMFFVASAPLDANGHANLSPKGLDTFRILAPRTVGYLDLTGSGIETVAHLKENGRITLMFCAFQGAPKTLRLYGRGRVVEPGDADFPALRSRFPQHDGVRSIVMIELTDIIDSCGFGVPLFRYEGQREQHPAWARKIGPEAIRTYQRKNNRRSLDGLAGLADSLTRAGEPAWAD